MKEEKESLWNKLNKPLIEEGKKYFWDRAWAKIEKPLSRIGSLIVGIVGLIIIGVLIASVVAFFKIFDLGLFSSEITSYPVMCKEKVDYVWCENPDFPLNPTTYKVSSERQEVLYWMSGVGDRVEKSAKCAVKNRKNWSCKYNDESGEFGFADGRYWENSLLPFSATDETWEKVYYVSRFEWVKITCRNNAFYVFCVIFGLLTS